MTSLERVVPHSANILFSDTELDARFAELEALKVSTFGIMEGVRMDLIIHGFTTEGAGIHKGRKNIHGFFPTIDDPNTILHLELYIQTPRSSIFEVKLRKMNLKEMLKARERTSIGSEETAVTKTFGPKGPVLCSHATLFALLEEVLSPVDKKNS